MIPGGSLLPLLNCAMKYVATLAFRLSTWQIRRETFHAALQDFVPFFIHNHRVTTETNFVHAVALFKRLFLDWIASFCTAKQISKYIWNLFRPWRGFHQVTLRRTQNAGGRADRYKKTYIKCNECVNMRTKNPNIHSLNWDGPVR